MEERLLAMQKVVGSNPISRSLDIFLVYVIVKAVDLLKQALIVLQF